MRGGASYDIPSNCVREENRVFGYYRPNMLTAPLSPQAASESHSLLPGRELMEHDEGSDSSLVTSSECTSPSPGSSQSEHSSAYYSSSSTESHTSSTLNSHSTTNPTKEAQTHQSILNQMTYIREHNSLTPLNFEPMISLMDSTPKSESDQVITLTPCTSSRGNSHDDDNKYGRDVDECDKQKLSATKITSSGKIKTVKCKQCDFVTTTKLDLWEHNIIHIEANKLLKCSECTFVTKYKHHLQFHLRNHSGSKPFRCTHCSYMCNNKSMLKSHLKSHSNLYPYRCAECNYASKYSHSLKLHLQKYNHRNHVILNSDGTPNLSSSIDVHGTRRGPKSTSKRSAVQNSPVPPQLDQFSIEQMRMQLQSQLLYCLYNPISNLSLHQNLQELITERHVQNSPHSPERERYSSGDYEEIASESGPLDLSKPEDASQKTQRNGTTRNDSVFLNSSDEEADYMTTMFENVEIVHTQEEPSSETDDHEETSASSNKPEEYYCQHCQITFGEPTMYTIHMGYHGHEEPFTCNMCGEVSDDKVSFSIHIARAPHPM